MGKHWVALTVIASLTFVAPRGDASIQDVQTVFIILMENQDWQTIKESPSASYINNQLLPMASYAEHYFNPPGLHPSLPNYLWLEAGTNFNVSTDILPSAGHQSSTNHLVTLLKNAGISWRSYQEDICGCLCPLVNTNLYLARHNPVVYFDDVTNTNNANSAFCIANVRPYTQLAGDLQSNTVARYNFLTPNACNDMHNSSGCGAGTAISHGDAWLSNNIPQILNSQAYSNNGAIFIVWDEGPNNSDGPIGMIVLSPLAKGGGYSNAVEYTHGSTLLTMQEIFNVGPLLGGAAKAVDLRDLFVSGPEFSVSPASGPTSSGGFGGPFSPASQTYTLTNADTLPLFWSATPTSSWVTVSATIGTLGAGMSTNITAFITNSAAKALVDGTYTDIIQFSNRATVVSISRSVTLTVASTPPAADFSASPTNGTAPLLVTFSDTSTGTVTNRFWNFGDSVTTNVPTSSVSHTYTAGVYTVTLIARGPAGISTNTKPNYIAVLPTPSTILADAGNLYDKDGILLPTNRVAVLVADTGNNGFVDPQPAFLLKLGATWGTDDKVVGLWDLGGCDDCGDGYLYDQTVVGYTNGVAPGQKLQLYWFPSLTLASNTVGLTYYGKYRDTNSPPQLGDAWSMPAGGSSVHLAFYTVIWGGSNPETAGEATNLTTVPVAAAFTASPTSGLAPLAVTFTDTSSGTGPLTLYWNLGDSTLATNSGGASFGHSYAAGTYTVTLLASNAGGISTLVSNNLIAALTVFQNWQMQYFNSTNCATCAGDADFDGDGMSNTNEFLSGTDPTNSASALRIISVTRQTTNIVVTWQTAGGKTNVLQATNGDPGGNYNTNGFVDIVDPNSPTIITGSGNAVTNQVDWNALTNGPSRYYRIRLQP